MRALGRFVVQIDVSLQVVRQLTLLGEAFRAPITAVDSQFIRHVHLLLVPPDAPVIDETFVADITPEPIGILQPLDVLQQTGLLGEASPTAHDGTWYRKRAIR